jgi:bifunctional UDP-N-acetylglucosamine pyrophosphorylase/glucosamine-1-phosphate N-acetyltransferase
MGKISTKLADISVFTAEDPRSENIFDILSAIVKGAKSGGGIEEKNFVRIPERGEAIAYALSIAQKGDVVGIFGKGHEKSMAYKGFEHPWDDNQMVHDWINRNKSLSAIVLAAGKGTRMKSDLPKILHPICGRPMIAYSLQNLRRAKIGEIITVVSYRKNLVIKEIAGTIKVAYQKDSKGGTGQATKCGLELVGPDCKYILVFYGDDSAFFKSETIRRAIDEHIKDQATVSFASAVVENPFGLGRVLRSSSGKVLGIVEEKAANDEQKKINEINCGNFIFNKDWLTKNINKLEKSASGEYYINNLVQAAIDQDKKVMAYKLKDRSEWQGVNTPEQLADANIKMVAYLMTNN